MNRDTKRPTFVEMIDRVNSAIRLARRVEAFVIPAEATALIEEAKRAFIDGRESQAILHSQDAEYKLYDRLGGFLYYSAKQHFPIKIQEMRDDGCDEDIVAFVSKAARELDEAVTAERDQDFTLRIEAFAKCCNRLNEARDKQLALWAKRREAERERQRQEAERKQREAEAQKEIARKLRESIAARMGQIEEAA